MIEGIFDRKSYYNGLGALVDTANGNGYNKQSNEITDNLPINLRGKSILILRVCKKESLINCYETFLNPRKSAAK